jgi:very-short-patch-repair endonuclease
MKKLDYIIKQISKTNKKNLENYVITRIWHLINDLNVKLITQQYVRRVDGYALTDLYLPQFDLHIEIDENHHTKQIKLDFDRETDIIEATNHELRHIKFDEDIDKINKQVDEIVDYIAKLKEQKNFEPWDLDKEFNPDNYRKKGYLNVKENPTFRRIVDACNCLGQNYKGCQRAWVKSKVYDNHYLWFPKFYENADWDNRLDDNGVRIIEKPKKKGLEIEKHYEWSIKNPVSRIVFPRSINNLGFVLYRFKGIYTVDKEESSIEKGIVFKRIDTKFQIK